MKRRAENGLAQEPLSPTFPAPPASPKDMTGIKMLARPIFWLIWSPRRWLYVLCLLCAVLVFALVPSGGGAGASVGELLGALGFGSRGLRHSCGRPPAVDPSLPATAEKAAEISRALDGCGLDTILSWVAEAFPQQVEQFTSFGPTGLVVIDRFSALGLLDRVPVVTIDTLHLFDETHELIANVSRRYPEMRLRTFYPEGFAANQKFKFDVMHGDDLWTEDFDRYTYLTKVEPTLRALRELAPRAWLTGRRRSQGGERAALPVVEADDDGRFKVNPLASWTSPQVWSYIREHSVPYNSLHDKGYKSVGDTMNTRPVADGESERAGRFMYSGQDNRSECGMHAHQAKIEAYRKAAAEAEDRGQKPKLPELPCEGCSEVNPDNFDELVLGATSNILVEFYSPICGHCQHFGPTFQELINKLFAEEPQRVTAALRWDMLSHQPPKRIAEAGFQIAAYPSIYLVMPDGAASTPRLARFDGEKELEPILAWIDSKLAGGGGDGSDAASPEG